MAGFLALQAIWHAAVLRRDEASSLRWLIANCYAGVPGAAGGQAALSAFTEIKTWKVVHFTPSATPFVPDGLGMAVFVTVWISARPWSSLPDRQGGQSGSSANKPRCLTRQNIAALEAGV